MNIYIYRNRQNFGPYSEESIRKFLEERKVTDDDWAWRSGRTKWTRLGKLLTKDAEGNLEAMPEEKVLSKEIAEQFLSGNASIDFRQFNQIDEDAAKVLSRTNAPLIFSYQSKLSENAASHFASYNGCFLAFDTDFGQNCKDHVGSRLLTRMMFESRTTNTKTVRQKLSSLEKVNEEFIKKIDSISTRVVDLINGFDTSESEYLASYELFFILTSKKIHDVSSTQIQEICSNITNQYVIWNSLGRVFEIESRNRMDEWVKNTWILSEKINGEISELCLSSNEETIPSAFKYLHCKLREEFLDAKREWGYF